MKMIQDIIVAPIVTEMASSTFRKIRSRLVSRMALFFFMVFAPFYHRLVPPMRFAIKLAKNSRTILQSELNRLMAVE